MLYPSQIFIIILLLYDWKNNIYHGFGHGRQHLHSQERSCTLCTWKASCKDCKIHPSSAITVSHGQPMREFMCVLHLLIVLQKPSGVITVWSYNHHKFVTTHFRTGGILKEGVGCEKKTHLLCIMYCHLLYSTSV